MAALYTIDQTLQPKDYYSKVIKAFAHDRPLQAILKRGPVPEQWEQQIEVEGDTTSYNLKAAEGGDFDETGLVARTNLMLGVQVEKFRSTRGYFVTRETRMLPGYTEKKGEKALARSIRKDAEEVTLSIERAISSGQEAVLRGTAANTVPVTRGLMCWLQKLTTRTDAGATALHGVHTIPKELCPVEGLTANLADATVFNESIFKTMLINAAKQAGDGHISLTGLVGLNLKAAMSGWLGKATTVNGMDTVIRRTEPKTRKIELICDEFSYDGVSVRTIVDNNLGCTMGNAGAAVTVDTAQYWAGAFIRPEFWTIDTLEALTAYDLEDKGGGPRGYHEAILRLACRNPVGQFALQYQAANS